MPVRPILQLGNPKLYEISTAVEPEEVAQLAPVVSDLHDTLIDFRDRYGAGRAIAAPQIGVMKRLLYMYIDQPVVFINPLLAHKSDAMIRVWDDCMSFPDLLVEVQRHQSCRIDYYDQQWTRCSLPLADDLSELLQHEYDHLDGVLAVSRAIGPRSLALRSQKAFLD